MLSTLVGTIMFYRLQYGRATRVTILPRSVFAEAIVEGMQKRRSIVVHRERNVNIIPSTKI